MTAVSNVLILLTVLAAVIYTSSASTEFYSDKYDFVDIDKILNNERVRKQYSKCILGTGLCLTPEARFIKETFPEAVATRCKRCTKRQEKLFEKIVVFYMEKDPEDWKKLLENVIRGQKS